MLSRKSLGKNLLIYEVFDETAFTLSNKKAALKDWVPEMNRFSRIFTLMSLTHSQSTERCLIVSYCE